MEKNTVEEIKQTKNITAADLERYIEQLKTSIERLECKMIAINEIIPGYEFLMHSTPWQSYDERADYFEAKIKLSSSEKDKYYYTLCLEELKKEQKITNSENKIEKIQLRIKELEQEKQQLINECSDLKDLITACENVIYKIATKTILKDESAMQKIVDGWIENKNNTIKKYNDQLKENVEKKKKFDELFDFFEPINFELTKGDFVNLIKVLKKDDNIEKIGQVVNKTGSEKLKELLAQIKNIEIKDSEKQQQIIETYKDEFKDLMIYYNASKYTKKDNISQEIVNEFFENDLDTTKTLFLNRDITFTSNGNAGRTKFITIDQLKSFINDFNRYDIPDATKKFFIKDYKFDIDKTKDFINRFDLNNLSLEEAYIIYEKLATIPIDSSRSKNNEQLLLHPEINPLKFNIKYSMGATIANERNNSSITHDSEMIKKLQSEIEKLNKASINQYDVVKEEFKFPDENINDQQANAYETIMRNKILAGEIDMTMSQDGALEVVQGRRK